MKGTLLALETSTTVASLALWSAGSVIYSAEFSSERTANSVIFAPLKEALDLAGKQLAGIVVGLGPGSYAGVRVGISAAIGIQLVREVPLIGLCSQLAYPKAERYAVVGDARRGQWHLATVANGEHILQPHTGTAEEIAAALANWSGPVVTPDAAPPPFHPAATTVFPHAKTLAELASKLSPEAWATLSQHTPEPIYLAAPFITTPRSRA